MSYKIYYDEMRQVQIVTGVKNLGSGTWYNGTLLGKVSLQGV